MKYRPAILAVLVVIFLLSQFVGLFLVSGSISEIKTTPEGKIVIEHVDVAVERPELEGAESFIYLLAGILIATGLILLIVKLNLFKAWKLWFFIAVWLTITIALSVYLNDLIAAGIAFALGLLKLFKSNIITHNITEILMYAGIAVLFVPIFDVFWAAILLIAIAIYDMIAVWKTKHMVTMADFLKESQAFSGLFFKYRSGKAGKTKQARIVKAAGEPQRVKEVYDVALLGGGDVAFPLIFSGVLLEYLVTRGVGKSMAFAYTLIVPIIVGIILTALLIYAKKGRYYPAMPFVTAGCFIGFVLVSLLI